MGTIVLVTVGLFAALGTWPSLGAYGADFLRGIIGDKAVARLETWVFQIQDTVHKVEYDIGLVAPSPPWSATEVALTTPAASPTASQTAAPLSPTMTPAPLASTPSPTMTLTPSVVMTPTPTMTPTPSVWLPLPLTPLGSLTGEGTWSPYIQDAAGRTVAFRTFLQPDKKRPYTLVAVIAIDLSHTRLHFVLGSVEPYSPDGPKRSGSMPEADKTPGVLLAMFNGGFQARHGQFGAMADGITALPARDGLGTLAIYSDGHVRLGEWGTELTLSTDMIAFRQNGPLVIQHGEINPRIYNNSPEDWGYSLTDVSPTWRSAVGLSADGRVLFYFCGESLLMEPLAKSMQAAGAFNGIQLDINNYWVLFVAVRANGKKLTLEPLFPDAMTENIDRYLGAYTRDYFYVTGAP